MILLYMIFLILSTVRRVNMQINAEDLKRYINKLPSAKILVIGDLALDEMVYGDTERISREAPVLILQHTHTKHILGGASNAAHNVSSINDGKVSVIGIVGEDYQAEDLKAAFFEADVDCTHLVSDKERKTITKTRISGSCSQSVTQQIVRIDRQTNAPISNETENRLIQKIKSQIPLCDLIILSDYHIGTLSDNVIKSVFEVAKEHSKKVIVDAQKNYYRDAYSMTPNLPDTQKYIGKYLRSREDFIEAGMQMINENHLENVLITCGSDGMVVIEKGGEYTHIPVFNKSKVFDVTGAGDTVTALFSLAIAIGAPAVYAAVIGNIAAGIVVKQYGCATTTIKELLENLPSKISLEN